MMYQDWLMNYNNISHQCKILKIGKNTYVRSCFILNFPFIAPKYASLKSSATSKIAESEP